MNSQEDAKNLHQNQIRAKLIWARMLAVFSSQPPPQLLWIARTMENRQNGESFVFDGEIDVVTGKPAQSNPASLPTNLWESFRIVLSTLQSTIYFQKKLPPQTWTLWFIPRSRLVIFSACKRFENEPETHFQPKRLLSSALTCSQGIPSCGLASKSARRRSSSVACSGVKSGSNPSSTMMSQKSCASLILSSCGRAFAALRISVALMLRNDYVMAHFRLLSLSVSSAQTCSHGMPPSGLLLNRSPRRSASSICSGDKLYSESPNSGIICPATSRRSFSGKHRICSKISAALTPIRILETHAVCKSVTVMEILAQRRRERGAGGRKQFFSASSAPLREIVNPPIPNTFP
jgi:hypothetical protein